MGNSGSKTITSKNTTNPISSTEAESNPPKQVNGEEVIDTGATQQHTDDNVENLNGIQTNGCAAVDNNEPTKSNNAIESKNPDSVDNHTDANGLTSDSANSTTLKKRNPLIWLKKKLSFKKLRNGEQTTTVNGEATNNIEDKEATVNPVSNDGDQPTETSTNGQIIQNNGTLVEENKIVTKLDSTTEKPIVESPSLLQSETCVQPNKDVTIINTHPQPNAGDVVAMKTKLEDPLVNGEKKLYENGVKMNGHSSGDDELPHSNGIENGCAQIKSANIEKCGEILNVEQHATILVE